MLFYELFTLLWLSLRHFTVASQAHSGPSNNALPVIQGESNGSIEQHGESEEKTPFQPFHRETQKYEVTSSSCPFGQFPCEENMQLCVPQSAICNGKQDCPQNSDEGERCRNSHDDSFWDLYFPPRPDKDTEPAADDEDSCKYNVSILQRTSGNAVDEMGLATTDGCYCQQEKLICQNLHLHNLSIVPWDVEYLDLSGSLIESLDFNAPPSFPHLRHLILSSCAVSEISYGSFYKLNDLETLHLTGNQLSRIPNGALETNVNLEKLFLGYNHISTLEPLAFQGLSSLLELDLRNNQLKGTESGRFHPLSNLRTLHLSHNEIQVLEGSFLSGLSRLEILSLSSNRINSIQQEAFRNLTTLKRLYLSWNRLRVLEPKIFCNLHSLLDLQLNGNGLISLDANAFACLHSLESLNLEQSRFNELGNATKIFQNLTNLKYIYFDQFWMCSWAPHVPACSPKGDGISSIENLLDNAILRICVWIMGTVGILGNVFVIVSRLVVREPNPIHSFYIKNLALADLLMGIFLLSIAFHDVQFRGQFLAHQHSWRHSLTCQLSGVLSAWSSEASVLILALITLDRFVSIVRPFHEKNTALSFAVGVVSVLWVLSFLLADLPLTGLFPNYFRDFYTTNGLCLPLQIHNPYDSGWEYSFSLFIVLNALVFSFILYAYWKMLRVIRLSSVNVRTNQQRQDGVLAMRFSIIVLTDFFCWAPVITARALAMCGLTIPPDFYAWLAVFVLPVNSMLNPIIYTLTTKLFRQQISKFTVGVRDMCNRRGPVEESSVSLSLFSRARAHRQTITTSVHTSLRGSLAGSGKSNLRVHLGNGKGPFLTPPSQPLYKTT